MLRQSGVTTDVVQGISQMSAFVQSQEGTGSHSGTGGLARLSSRIAQLNLSVQKAAAA